jgi:DNA-binding CsgD family transcriptional regulator/GAF domain-containing protein
MFTIQDENDLLTALHDGLHEQPLWSTFLERLRQRANADYASIIFRPPDRPTSLPVELYAGTPSAPDIQQSYAERFVAVDPFLKAALREGRVYALGDLFVPGNPDHDAFRAHVLEPRGLRFMRIVRVTEPGGISATLNIARAQPDFTAAQGALLDRVGGHFRRALRNHIALERERLRASIAEDMMERLAFGWLTLDAGGCVVETSPEAKRILQHDCGLRIARSGRLTASRAQVDRKLTEAIRVLAAAPSERPRALEINRDPWVDMLLTPIGNRVESMGRTPVMIAYLQGDNQSAAGRHEQIAELFGLLPSEARLALALSRGMSIAEAGESLGLTLETARNYSKKIYAKMGARGQTDLIRYILTSVLALAKA